jgi:ADP-ribose pyrophosphatase YjhB (NUDIX family)
MEEHPRDWAVGGEWVEVLGEEVELAVESEAASETNPVELEAPF